MKIVENIKTYKNAKFVVGIILILPVLLFFQTFQTNAYKTGDKQLFENFAMGTEAFVINRIAVTDKLGPSSFEGMLGRIPELDNFQTAPVKLYRGRTKLDIYYNSFYNYLTEENFKPYYSNMGVQGRFFAWLYTKDILSPGIKFQNYRFIFSLVSSLVFAFFCFWVFKKFGILIWCFLVLTIMQLDWIVASASHLFWFLGLMFIPFVANFYILSANRISKRKIIFLLFIISYIFSLIKCLVSGFEVIPTFLVLNTLPVFFFVFDKSKTLIFSTIAFSIISVASLSGVLTSMLYQAHKISAITGDKDAGIKHLKSSFLRRSKAKIRPNMRKQIKESYLVSKVDVIKKYLPSEMLQMNILGVKIKFIAKKLLIFLFAISILTLMLRWLLHFNFTKELYGLILMTTISVVGPLSMFVVFSSLSYLHPHLVPITWSMPFGFLFVILVVKFIIEVIDNFAKIYKRKKPELVYSPN